LRHSCGKLLLSQCPARKFARSAVRSTPRARHQRLIARHI
jgi:hypothetical protein